MSKQIFVNLPVENVEKATAFYEALGFKKNPQFSNDKASAMVWSDEISVMLLSKVFFKTFIGNKVVADAHQSAQVGLCLTFETKAAVKAFADTAKAHGGHVYKVESGMPNDAMFGHEVIDLDGHLWEPLWMNPNFNPQNYPTEQS